MWFSIGLCEPMKLTITYCCSYPYISTSPIVFFVCTLASFLISRESFELYPCSTFSVVKITPKVNKKTHTKHLKSKGCDLHKAMWMHSHTCRLSCKAEQEANTLKLTDTYTPTNRRIYTQSSWSFSNKLKLLSEISCFFFLTKLYIWQSSSHRVQNVYFPKYSKKKLQTHFSSSYGIT